MNAVAQSAYLDTEAVVMHYKDMVYRIALSHTSNKTDAEDVFQEVFLAYHRKRPVFETDERCKAWLIVTTINCSKQATSNSWRKKVVPIHDTDIKPASEDSFHFRSEEEDRVFQALQELPLPYRTVLHLFYFDDLSIAQISVLQGIEAGAVKVQLSRGRAQLRNRLKGEYFND